LIDPTWQTSVRDCFCTIEQRRLNTLLAGAAIVCARSDDFQPHFDNVGSMIATAEARCIITHDEARHGRRAWVINEAELWLLTSPSKQRRARLLDPSPGPQAFIPPRRRLEMIRDLDKAA
jgi:hypothetical protein